MRICGAALFSAAAFCATAMDIHAQVNAQRDAQADSQNNAIKREIKVPPGRDVRVGIYTSIRSDCSSGPLPSIRLAVAPEHGTVTVKRATLKATNLKQCLAVEAPALVAFYRAAQDFTGADRFELDVRFPSGREERQDFQIIVSRGASEEQRI